MTPVASSLADKLIAYVDREAPRLVKIVQDLVQIPSENRPPTGAEAACQRYVAEFLRQIDLRPDIYSPDDVPGIREHPLYFAGRDYSNRPNVSARLAGKGQGRSLILSAHIDTVPSGALPWTRDPFSGAIDGNRLFGRGSNDMKGGVATNLFVFEALRKLNIRLAGDLVFETVVDEEFGGCNGTLAGRLRGYMADAAVISEPSFLRVCAAQRGGMTAHVVLRAASGGVLTDGHLPAGVVDQLGLFLQNVEQFAVQRRERTEVHPLYRNNPDPVPVSILKVFTGPWGMGEPMGIPEQCRIEMFWQTMPGETQGDVQAEFFRWLDGIFPQRPEVSFPLRWLPGSAIAANEPVVEEMAVCAASVSGVRPTIAGIEGPCDLFVFHQGFGIPGILWGARGGNTHAADEYLEIDSVIQAAKTLLLFVCQWCGVTED